MQAIPEDAINDESDDEDKSNPDERISIRASDKRIAPENEYSDSEDEGDSRRDQRWLFPSFKFYLLACLYKRNLLFNRSFKGNRKRPRTESTEGGVESKPDDKEEVSKNVNGEKENANKENAKESDKKQDISKANTEHTRDGTSSTSDDAKG